MLLLGCADTPMSSADEFVIMVESSDTTSESEESTSESGELDNEESTTESEESTTESGESTTESGESTTESTSESEESTTEGQPGSCGDGNVDADEECDDGGVQALDGCSASCEWESRIAFTTSTLHDGNLGGLAGADAICNARAQAADLPGTYMAWLSTDQGSPATRFVHSSAPYVTVTGVKIADNWADLIDDTLDSSMSVTELGSASPYATPCLFNGMYLQRTAFTGTNSDGMIAPATCNNFTSNAADVMGQIGVSNITTFYWTNCTDPIDCAGTSTIYCFQQ
jgi:cysteine-rich repeat protein